MPPPITSSRRASPSSSSAEVESRMRGSSGRPGSRAAREPTAMIACSKRDRALAVRPSRPRPLCGSAKRAAARHAPATLALLRELREPAGRARCTTASLCARSFAKSSFGAPNSTPCVGEVARRLDHLAPRAAAPSTGCSRRSGRRRRAPGSARRARRACRGRRRGTPRCSRRARRRARARRRRQLAASRPCAYRISRRRSASSCDRRVVKRAASAPSITRWS